MPIDVLINSPELFQPVIEYDASYCKKDRLAFSIDVNGSVRSGECAETFNCD